MASPESPESPTSNKSWSKGEIGRFKPGRPRYDLGALPPLPSWGESPVWKHTSTRSSSQSSLKLLRKASISGQSFKKNRNNSNNRIQEDPFMDSNSSDDSQAPTRGLFYAYARRTDNYWASRYILTFATASVCDDWWSLVQSEYPNQAVRHGPQLFSFEGDDFPQKPSKSKKFEHLKTQWFYAQFGDATGTGGRPQEILPAQDYTGRFIGGGGSGGGDSIDVPSKGGKGKTRASNDDEEPHGNGSGSGGGFDMNALAECLQSTQAMLESNNAQIAQLTESQAREQERVSRVESILQETANQLQTVTRSHAASQKQNQELAEQNLKLIKELRKSRSVMMTTSQQQQQNQQEQQKQPQQPEKQQQPADTTQLQTSQSEMQAKAEACAHNVHPPPRKIDKQLIGYAYEQNGGGNHTSAKKRADPTKRTASAAATAAADGKH